MDAFPAYFPLAGRRIVIAGSGEGADAKARLLASSPAEIVRLEGAQARDPDAYAGAALIFIASPDPDFIASAIPAARTAHCPVNVVDRPELCDFTTPAVIDRGEVVAAIGTGGASPMLATMLRQDIEARVPEGAGRVAALFRQMQDEIRSALPGLADRRAFLRDALNGPIAEAALAGDMEGAKQALRLALGQTGADRGQLEILDGSGPADLITLRALRALSAADVLVNSPGVSPAILDLARRDAERFDLDDLGMAGMAALVGKGLRVIWVSSGLPEASDLAVASLRPTFLPLGNISG
jgi:precorrin-2 dehydrogenase/sirohydrochlorin ferrochelatase